MDRTDDRRYSTELRERCDSIFEAFWDHPFLAGLRDGTLARERVLWSAPGFVDI